MTRIVFDANGRPSWFNVNTDAFMHKLSDFQKLEAIEFSESEKAWFKRPLGAERSE